MSTKVRSNKKRWILAIGIVLVASGAGAWMFFKRQEPVIQVQTETVTRRNLTETVLANGRIQPVTQVKISPEVSGEIIELPVKEGQSIKKGELLVRIKPDMYVAARNSAEASFKSAQASLSLSEASLRKAGLEHDRHKQLADANLISESAFLEVKTALDIARAQNQSARHQVDVARASLSRAEEELGKTSIFSPLTGSVSKLNSELGERVVGTAMMTGTEIMTVADLTVMEARVDVGEIDVVLIKPGQTAKLEVDAFRDRKFQGLVTEIANSSKGAGQTGGGGGQSQEATRFEVRIRIKDREVFRPGMSVTGEIETRHRTNVLAVPIQSVTTRPPKPPPGGTNAPPSTNASASAQARSGSDATNASGGGGKARAGEPPKPIEVVFLVEGEKARMAPVKRGISDDAWTEIIEGVKEGQEVVSGGHKAISRELDDGKRVKKGAPSEPQPATAR